MEESIQVKLGRSGMSIEAREALAGELDELFGELDDREEAVLAERLLTVTPRTLGDVGDDFGITRERVRQIEAKFVERMTERVVSPVSPILCELANQLVESLGLVIPVMDGLVERLFSLLLERGYVGTERQIDGLQLAAVVLRIAGLKETTYKGQHYWGDAKGLFAAVDEALDASGMLMASDLEDLLVERGVKMTIFSKLVDDEKHLRFTSGMLVRWGRSQSDDAATVLALMGEPCSVEEIVEELGRSVSTRSLSNRLLEDDRFVRATKTTFGLKEWGGDGYSSITVAIQQELERCGGEDLIEGIAVRISAKYGVAQSSVRSYLDAPAFVVAGGRAHLRGKDEPFVNRTDPRKATRTFLHVDGFSIVITVDRDVLRGSGRGLSRSVAAAIGLEAGSEQTFGEGDLQVSFAWPMTSHSPSIGSTRWLAQEVGAELGHLLRIDVSGSTVSAVRLPAELATAAPSKEALSALVGIEPGGDDWEERLRWALQAGPGEDLVRVAAQKDDELLVRLIPDELVR